MEAGTLNCPSCGVAVSSSSPQCQYCHALLQTVACPKCFGMMFLGSKFCPHCGASTVNIDEGGQTKRPCPRCHADLTTVPVGKTPRRECGHCGGLWIDVKQFDGLCSDAEAQTAAMGLQLPPPVEIDVQVRYLNCPQCGKMMNEMNYAGRSGVVMQICRSHGIGLDRDEIRQIIEFIRAGGLERARQLEMQELQYERATMNRAHEIPSLNDLSLQGSIAHVDNTLLAADLVTGLAAVVGHFMK